MSSVMISSLAITLSMTICSTPQVSGAYAKSVLQFATSEMKSKFLPAVKAPEKRLELPTDPVVRKYLESILPSLENSNKVAILPLSVREIQAERYLYEAKFEIITEVIGMKRSLKRARLLIEWEPDWNEGILLDTSIVNVEEEINDGIGAGYLLFVKPYRIQTSNEIYESLSQIVHTELDSRFSEECYSYIFIPFETNSLEQESLPITVRHSIRGKVYFKERDEIEWKEEIVTASEDFRNPGSVLLQPEQVLINHEKEP